MRVGDEELLQRVWGEHEAPQRFGGDHVRRRGLAEQAGDLTEEVARSQVSALLAADDDVRAAVQDNVKACRRETLAYDPLALGEVDLAEGLHDVLQLGRAHVREQRETRKDVDYVWAYFHVPFRRKLSRTVPAFPS